MKPEIYSPTLPDEVPCSFPNCGAIFDSKEAMIDHKIGNPGTNHTYCEECDLDLDSWTSLLAHKVASEKHIACPLCGMDFKSAKGMCRHISFQHRKVQNITCLGCQKLFASAGAMISHMERGFCAVISKEDFFDNIYRKEIFEAILSNASNYGISVNGLQSVAHPTTAHSVSASSTSYQDDGGVSLGPLEARSENDRINLGPYLTPMSQRNTISTEDNVATEVLSYSINGLTIGDEAGSATTVTKVPFASTTQCSNTNSGNFPALDNLSDARSRGPRSDGPSRAVTATKPYTTPAHVVQGFQAGINDLNRAYSPIYPRPPGTEVEVMRPDGVPGMFQSKFWDPSSEHYNPEIFFNTTIEHYTCPFPHCSAQFVSPSALTQHLASRTQHKLNPTQTRNRCPRCQRIFKTVAALISHLDSPSLKCRIRETDQYAQAVDRVTGGYLEVVREDDAASSDGGKGELWESGPTYAAVRPPDFW